MFCDAPRATMNSSQVPKPRGPMNRRICVFDAVSVSSSRILSFTGAGVSPSPRIAVVMPCVTIESASPSPRMKLPYDWAWMSMKPGATTCPVAFTRCAALARANAPRGPMEAIRSPRSATSP